jgi:hypothetical protein
MKINMLEVKLTEAVNKKTNIEDDLNKAVKALSTLNGINDLEDGKLSRELIGSMYPEKFTFENLKDRTARVNEVADVIWQINSQLQVQKQRTSDEKSCLPSWVLLNVQLTHHFLDDMRHLANLLKDFDEP